MHNEQKLSFIFRYFGPEMSDRCVLNYTVNYIEKTRPYIKRSFYAEHLKPNEPYEEKEIGKVNDNPKYSVNFRV